MSTHKYLDEIGLEQVWSKTKEYTNNVAMGWTDVYSDWVAGYYYDDKNNYAYTQIPEGETMWGSDTMRIKVACTPYNNLIPVHGGEKYKYTNPKIHMNSTNSYIPSIVIFDSDKNGIQSYEGSTQFTIPNNGVWMAVLHYNDQEYALRKLEPKTVNEISILTDIIAHYNNYISKTPIILNSLDKAYFCFGTDDLRRNETKNLHELYTNNNIPYYMAAIPGAIQTCITDDPYKTNLDYMKMCVENGGEIISHSNPVITKDNKTDFDTMYQYFYKNKKQLEFYGFNVRGIFKAGGNNAIYDATDPIIDAWATYYYDFGDLFTESYPYKNSRVLLDDWANYSSLDSRLEDACENHKYMIFTLHAYNAKAQEAIDYILSYLSTYERGVDYQFVTPSQLYDLLVPKEDSSIDNDTTYSLSISNNIITLTGSNNITSTITLPVYNGGIST